MTSLGLLDDTLRQFDAAAAAAYPELLTIALQLWTFFAVLQFGIIAARLIRTHDIRDLLNEMVFFGIVAIMLVRVFIEHALEWGGDVIGTGEQIAALAGGMSLASVTPSGILDQGLNIVTILWNNVSLGTWLAHPRDALVLWIAGAIVGISFFFSALIYLGALLQATYTIAWGSLVLPFAVLEFTWPILIRWGTRVLEIAVKLAVILLLVGAATTLISNWTIELTNGIVGSRGPVWDFWALMITLVSFLFFTLLWSLPRAISGLVGGSMSPSSGEHHIQTANAAVTSAGASALQAGGREIATTAQELAHKVRSMITQTP